MDTFHSSQVQALWAQNKPGVGSHSGITINAWCVGLGILILEVDLLCYLP